MLQKFNESLIGQSLQRHAIISITDVNGVIIYANDNFCAITGWTQEELIGKTHKVISSEQQSKEFWAGVWRIINARHAWHGEVACVKKNGEHCWLDTGIFPLLEGSKIVGFMSVRQDISDQKADLQNLKNLKDRIIADSAIKSDFISIAGEVMHESMAGISSMIAMLSQADLDSSTQNILESAKACADSLSASIKEMQNFSAITAGNMDIEMDEVHPVVLIKSVFALYADQILKKNLQYSITVSRNDFPQARVLLDCAKVRMIVNAMLENALHVTNKGRIAVDVSINRKTGLKSELIISVHDTGPGIDEAMASIIFEPVQKRSLNKDNAIGFGLPLAKRFAKMIGGSLRADNTMNGSVIVLNMEADVIHTKTAESPDVKKNILLVGNGRSIDNLYLKVKEVGDKVTKATSAKAALKSLLEIGADEGVIDMVIVDASVNDIAPIELAHSIRKMPGLDKAAMVLSGYLDTSFKNAALNGPYIACVDHTHDIDLASDVIKSILTPAKSGSFDCPPRIGKSGHGKASVLIVADAESSRSIAADLNKAQCNIVFADTAEEMLEISNSVNFSVIIADINIEGVKHASQRMVMRGAMLSLFVPIIAACKEMTPDIWETSMAFGFTDVIDISNSFSIWDSVSKWVSPEAKDAQSSSSAHGNSENTILIADGDAVTRKTLRKFMEEENYRVIEAKTGSEVISMHAQYSPDLILLDADLPLVNGFDACMTIKSSVTGADCPIVIITDRNDEISATRAMDSGAIDFIQKPIFLPVLRQRVQNIMISKTAQRHIEHLAYHDRLTSLPNRIMFDEKIDIAIKVAAREQTKVAVMFMDLDRFKNVNDSLGHQAGDKLLQQAADRMRNMIRPGDILARMGGDEFTVLLQNIDMNDSDVNAARRVAERIISVMNERFDIDGHPVHVGVSIGIAVSGTDGNDSETLLKNADTALYASKDAGRNKFTFFSSSMNEQVAEKIRLEEGLRNAIVKREVIAYYQPQVDVQTGRVIGMEALARWRKADGSLISPAKFIPVAEESGMIVKIGEQIMTEACSTVVEHLREGLLDNDFKISVNLSPVQFMSPGLTDTVRRVIKTTGIPAHMLHLEITESLAMKNVDMVQTTLREIKEFGVGVAMDDFGTGFCSLSYLKMFPIDTLKIDQSFMRGVTEEDAERGDAAIVRAIISMSKAMGIMVVAEGVETQSQIDFLKETGADAAQGYLLHKPDTFAKIKEWMLKRNASE